MTHHWDRPVLVGSFVPFTLLPGRTIKRPAICRIALVLLVFCENSKRSDFIVNVMRANGFPIRLSDSSMGGEAGQFHTTRWTLVRASAQDQNQMGREALAALCRNYWYPLYAFARRRGYAQH